MKGMRDIVAVLIFLATGLLVHVAHAAPTAKEAVQSTESTVDSVVCEESFPALSIRS